MYQKEMIKNKVDNLKRMDKAIRCLNDEEHPALWTWLEEGVPDGSSDEDLEDFIISDDNWYAEMCVLFAELISKVITEGDINDRGFLIEFWRGK